MVHAVNAFIASIEYGCSDFSFPSCWNVALLFIFGLDAPVLASNFAWLRLLDEVSYSTGAAFWLLKPARGEFSLLILSQFWQWVSQMKSNSNSKYGLFVLYAKVP